MRGEQGVSPSLCSRFGRAHAKLRTSEASYELAMIAVNRASGVEDRRTERPCIRGCFEPSSAPQATDAHTGQGEARLSSPPAQAAPGPGTRAAPGAFKLCSPSISCH